MFAVAAQVAVAVAAQAQVAVAAQVQVAARQRHRSSPAVMEEVLMDQ